MKALILLLLLTACASQPLAVQNSCVYIPLVINESSIQPAGCEGIQTNITLHYLLEDRFEEYQVIDCLGLDENWEKTLKRPEIVEADGRWGIAQEGLFEGWLQVLIWEGSDEPYILNLTN